MSVLNQYAAILGKALQPPYVPPSDQYNGLEFKWWKFAFRPAEYRTEGYLVAFLLAYLITWFFGSRTISQKAKAWLKAHRSLYGAQFSKPSPANGELVQDGFTSYFIFSTGRRYVKTLHSTFEMRPLHDLLQLIVNFGWGLYFFDYKSEDVLQLDFHLQPSVGGPSSWVWAIVNKNYLNQSRQERWDLSFTKTSDHPSLPITLTVMTEAADVTDALFKSISSSNTQAKNLLTAISDPAVQPYFHSLIITDQPGERPKTALNADEKERHLVLTLTVPPASKAADTLPLVQAVFGLVDLLGGNPPQLRPDTKNKLRKMREDVDVELKKDAEKEKREQEEDAKRSEKAKKKEEKIAKLSAAEQKKLLEKDQKRAFRKAQGKMVKK
ncbi:DUF1682-domain-containing protein [Sistotremastrum suecicum HHB10207 ss-3]|uniref:DUF1682-domain-containing protein n=1 Tax=Sistotremastrum suecicum HHB10207 ss-3 TaxID=1314776 RepID=A0A166EHK9_9AGAM|nr:DUF1682-domain-containing protein [Sistotremastrum suecicum HHB10207 ss-3]